MLSNYMSDCIWSTTSSTYVRLKKKSSPIRGSSTVSPTVKTEVMTESVFVKTWQQMSDRWTKEKTQHAGEVNSNKKSDGEREVLNPRKQDVTGEWHLQRSTQTEREKGWKGGQRKWFTEGEGWDKYAGQVSPQSQRWSRELYGGKKEIKNQLGWGGAGMKNNPPPAYFIWLILLNPFLPEVLLTVSSHLKISRRKKKKNTPVAPWCSCLHSALTLQKL